MAAAIAACHPLAPTIVFLRGGFRLAFIPREGRRRYGARSCIDADRWPLAAGREAIDHRHWSSSSDGVVRCALFNSPAAFPKIGQEWRGVIAPIRGGAANCVFAGVPAGTYAVAFFHAEHNETQLTTGLFGKPQQGYGFSNNATGSFGPPNFSAAAFRYDGGNLALQGALTY